MMYSVIVFGNVQANGILFKDIRYKHYIQWLNCLVSGLGRSGHFLICYTFISRSIKGASWGTNDAGGRRQLQIRIFSQV